MSRILSALVLGVGGNVGQGIMLALKHSQINLNIIGACINFDSLGLYYCDKAYISPYADDPHFASWLVDVCNKEKIDVIFSGVEEIILAIEQLRHEVELKPLFVCATLDKLLIGNNKLLTCEWLKNNNLNYPRYADAKDSLAFSKLVAEIGFPLLAKPKEGKGSKGVRIINNYEDFNSIDKDLYVIQEILGDEESEYTVGCYLNKHSVLEGMIVFKRQLKYGTTFKAEIISDRKIEDECRKICEKFASPGPLNIQLRVHNGKPVCFELNVRYSGTTAMRAHWGFNDVAAQINEYILDVPCGLHPQKEGIAYRYFNEAYIDFDMQTMLAKLRRVDDCTFFDNQKESM